MGRGSKAAGIAVAFKLIEAARGRWRAGLSYSTSRLLISGGEERADRAGCLLGLAAAAGSEP
jgi:hypothetical protein